jgi:hypothetical protein
MEPEPARSSRIPEAGPNIVCDEKGNTPLHLALRVEGILSENGFYATAVIVRSGADLFALNSAGENAVTLVEVAFSECWRAGTEIWRSSVKALMSWMRLCSEKDGRTRCTTSSGQIPAWRHWSK